MPTYSNSINKKAIEAPGTKRHDGSFGKYFFQITLNGVVPANPSPSAT